MDYFGRELALLVKVMRARFELALAEVGASLPAWTVLSQAAAEDGLSQRQLAQRVRIEAATLTPQLDRLESDGLIRRERDPDDRRVLRVSLTPAGRRLHTRLEQVVRRADAALTAGLADEEVAELRRLLAHLAANLERLPDAHAGNP